MKKTLIQNVTAVTMCEEQKVIENANIVIEGNRIAYLGEKAPDAEYDIVIDGTGKIAMPGLINTHAHTAMTILRSYADDMNLQDWLFQKIFPFEKNLTGQMVWDGSVNGIKEMLETGTTCYQDMYFFEEETMKVSEQMGIRAVLSDCVDQWNIERKLPKILELIKQAEAGSGRVTVNLSPHSVYTCTPENLKTCAAFAKEHGISMHTHLSETRVENENCIKDYGMSPAALMEECGVFDQKTVAAHCVWLSDEDREILNRKGVSISHNVISNLKLASGVAEIPKAQAAGINVSIGTDSASSNNNLDMFEEIKTAALLQKGVTYDPTALPAWEVLKMATVNGAKALGFEDLGQLKEGYLADLILLDFDVPKFKPNYNTVSNLAYAASGGDVVLTMVDGAVVYEKKGGEKKWLM